MQILTPIFSRNLTLVGELLICISDSISVFFAGFSGADRRGSTDGGCRKPSALVPRDKELAHTGLQQTNMTI